MSHESFSRATIASEDVDGEQKHRVTLRSILNGLILGISISIWTPYNIWSLKSSACISGTCIPV
ncbi:uncharacterized protein METZ01_LOCUS294158 [marine metagenome]|uniref:Uncharacterized protein n=1 Tax=marine metagenome TaxID=408172 RepID=A0A382LX35_9ZZZZ